MDVHTASGHEWSGRLLVLPLLSRRQRQPQLQRLKPARLLRGQWWAMLRRHGGRRRGRGVNLNPIVSPTLTQTLTLMLTQTRSRTLP